MNLEEQIQRYLDGGLDEEQVAKLSDVLRDSSEARKTYWELTGTHVLLDRIYRETSGAEWAESASVKKVNFRWLPTIAAAVIAVVVTWWIVEWRSDPASVIVATTNNGSEFLERGSLTLKEGETKEITFLKGTRVALQGPLAIELISDERMRLITGKIGVEVPEGAEGFTVETPDGEVIDYGTRFGLEVDNAGDLRAEVFQGRIDVVIGEKIHRMEGQASLEVSGNSQSLTPGSDSSSFPMPSLKEAWQIGGSFNRVETFKGGRPKLPNKWSGDLLEIATSFEEVRPRSEGGMLHFKGTSAQEDVRDTVASQLWRIVDLYEVREKMGRRPERVNLSGWVNRVAGDDQTDRDFLFGLSCHQEITEALDEGGDVTTKVLTSLISDSDPETWERADLQLHLPPNLRYLVIMVGAREDVSNNEDGQEFDGHFLDDLNLVFAAGMRRSIDYHYWRGSAGEWETSGKWSENREPSAHSYTVIQGPGTATVSGAHSLDSGSLVIALDNDSQGSVELKSGSLLNLDTTETLVGYNRGAHAELLIEGSLVTNGRIYIGRNNKTSRVEVTGSLLSSDLIQLCQYDSDEDTSAELVVDGGKVTAQSLRLIFDQSKLTLKEGEIDVQELVLGGESGQAHLVQYGGMMRVEKMTLGNGTYELLGGELWIKTASDRFPDFLPNALRSIRGEWTLITAAQ